MSEGYEIPYADPITARIDMYRRSADDLERQRIRFQNRAVDPETGEVRAALVDELATVLADSESRVKSKVSRLVKKHPMGDWLVEAKTAGRQVATVLSIIRNPHRFPSQQCSEGCHLLPTFEPGDLCPCLTTPEKGETPEPCPGEVQPWRGRQKNYHGNPVTGCRAVWHMFGLYPEQVNGTKKLASYRKGRQGSFNVRGKTAILMPQGIADQFLMQESRYAADYYEAKERLAKKNPDRADGWVHMTAKVIAAKAWLGDLLMEWKSRLALEGFA